MTTLINLVSVSPVSFLLAKNGDHLTIKKKLPNKFEFRGSLGKATTMFIVFKGQTKIGIIPPDFIKEFESIYTAKKTCLIKNIDASKKIITVEI